MISVRTDAAAAIESLWRWRGRFRTRLRETIADGAAALLNRVRAKLSGDVLHARSGALLRSIRAETGEDDSGIGARVFSDGSVPYAHIQEYGGRIALPEIRPVDAKALAFARQGQPVIAKRARAHAVVIPGRSYMRTSLAEFAPDFTGAIRKIPDTV